jgi:endonuclease/exonuclease/phosphatase family metal-dependent hydrolase
VSTFNSFKSFPVDGDKIDYILVQPGTKVLDAAIIRTSRHGRYPSDHFPVTARIALPPVAP